MERGVPVHRVEEDVRSDEPSPAASIMRRREEWSEVALGGRLDLGIPEEHLPDPAQPTDAAVHLPEPEPHRPRLI